VSLSREREEITRALKEGKMVVIKADTPSKVEGQADKVKVIVRSRG